MNALNQHVIEISTTNFIISMSSINPIDISVMNYIVTLCISILAQ